MITKHSPRPSAPEQEVIPAPRAADLEREYQAVADAGRAALEMRDYSEAIKQAELALKLKPGDKVASNLVAGMRVLLAQATPEQNYRAATNAAWAALQRKDYSAVTSQSPPRPIVERYPTMECDEWVEAGKEFAVQVSLTTELKTPEVRVTQGATNRQGQLRLSLPDQENWKIDVVMAAPLFKFRDGVNVGSLILPRDGDSTPAVFYLTARSVHGANQTGKLFATLWHNGNYLAKLEREISIGQEGGAPKQSPAALSQPARAERAQPLDLTQPGPDLTVYVLERPTNDQVEDATIIVNSPYLDGPRVGSYKTPGPALAAWLQVQYDKFARASPRGIAGTHQSGPPPAAPKEETLALMRGFGHALYDHFIRPEFKEVLKQLSARPDVKIQTLQIYSNNPLLPWELAWADEDNEALGAKFRVGRWHVRSNTRQLDKPPMCLRMKNLTVIAPRYTGTAVIVGQQTEIKKLKELPNFSMVSGTFQDVRALLFRAPEGIIHFAGHGAVRERQRGIYEYVIQLEEGPLDLETWRGLLPNNPNAHPLFFFNACEIGQSHQVANFVEGWAPAVLEGGASGYIGSLWPVGDDSAAAVSILFYQELVNHRAISVAEVMKKIRRSFQETGDPTFLAYVYYGDPNLEIIY